MFLLFITGVTMKQGFQPESIHDIKVGMKVLFRSRGWEVRGTVRYVGSIFTIGHLLGVELDEGEY